MVFDWTRNGVRLNRSVFSNHEDWLLRYITTYMHLPYEGQREDSITVDEAKTHSLHQCSALHHCILHKYVTYHVNFRYAVKTRQYQFHINVEWFPWNTKVVRRINLNSSIWFFIPCIFNYSESSGDILNWTIWKKAAVAVFRLIYNSWYTRYCI